MLEKDMYDSWKSIMELYMLNRQHGRMILESVENGLLFWPTVKENGVTRSKKYYELSTTEAIQANCDGESLRDFYLRFSLLLNDMNIYNMKLEQFQVNTKFLNTLPPEWSKFVTGVKLVRDLHTTNVDQLHAYLGKHEYHANEYASQAPSSTPISITYLTNDFQSSVNYNVYNLSSSIPQLEYASAVHQQSNFSQPDTRLVVPVFQKGPSRTLKKQRVIVCYNCKGEGHMSKQGTKPKRKRDEAWFKDKDYECDELNSAKIALMANLSHYGSDNLAEDNKNGNDFLTAELERYKDQVRILKEQNNGNKASESCAQSLEIDNLKHILSEYFKEKKCLEQKVTLLKNDFQKEESQNIDRELALEKQETLILEDESRSKMLQKQKDPMMSEKKVNTKPVEYAALNQLSQDFKTRFMPHNKLSAEQAFWSQYSVNSKEPNLSSSTTIVEVLEELPKVSMVNSSLKKLKFHLASFDVVVNKRTTATAITEGTWGFEHTKACFMDEIISFVKALKHLFNSFDQFLIDELTKVENVFNQMEQPIEQHCVEETKFQDKMNDTVNECERCVTTETELQRDFIKRECYDTLFKHYTTFEKHCIYLEVDNQLKQELFQRNNLFSQLKRLKSLSSNVKEEKIKRELEEIETINIELDHRVTKLVVENELLKQTYKQLYDSIKSSPIRSNEQCDDLIKQVNIKSAENSDLYASLQEKVFVITALKETLSKLKGKAIVNEAVTLHLIDPELLKIDVAPLASKLHNNRTAHNDYLKNTQEETTTLREIVENEILLNPLNTSLDYACKYTKHIQEMVIILKQTFLCINDLGTKLMAVTLKNNNRKIRFTEHILHQEIHWLKQHLPQT
nr:hypothetical protein [Tanacetum cinerariifolium]